MSHGPRPPSAPTGCYWPIEGLSLVVDSTRPLIPFESVAHHGAELVGTR